MENTSKEMAGLMIRETSGGGDKKGASGSSSSKRKEEMLQMIQPSLFTRPAGLADKRGSSGVPLRCLTNYIPVETTPDWTLHQYHVHFDPPVDSKFVRNKMINDQTAVLGEEIIFDGMILYLPRDLGGKGEQQHTELRVEQPRTQETVTITVKKTAALKPGDPQCITLFNLINRRTFQMLEYRQLGRHYYNPKLAHEVEKHNIEIWPGVISAIRCHEEQLLLCCEMSHKILRRDSVLDFMYDLYRKCADRFKEVCTQTLVGMSVLTRYNNKTYKVDDIIWDMKPTDEFEVTDGTKMTFVEYYKTQHGKTITDMKQPMLFSRAKKRGGAGEGVGSMDVFIVPELAAMTGLTDQMRSDRRVMQDLATFTRVAPVKRIEFSREYLRNITSSDSIQALLSAWSLQVGKEVAEVTARVLPAETLFGGGDSKWKTNAATGDWSRESRDYPLADAKPLTNWLLIFLNNDQPKAEEFYNTVCRIAPNVGMAVKEPTIINLENDRIKTYLDAIEFGMKQAADKNNGQPPSIVVAIIPNDNKTRYDAIKKLVCHDKPVPNQLIRSVTLSKNMLSVTAKILLQMNCKLGGSLWRVQVPMKNAMVIGYDAYQDSANRGKSVGAAVFSIEPTFGRWYSQCALHGESRDQIKNITEFCKNGLLKYYEVNNMLPDRIFLFRDGCGDGQIPVVFSQELPQVQEAIRQVGEKITSGKYSPKLAFVIVTKRVNSRFFEQKNGQLCNPPPGTVVDTTITRPERYDFLMVPQSVRQGTVTPVSYNVIFDESGLSPDQLQRLTYKLCHLYYNWQGTIRVPAPCQYAHKLAFLVGQSLHLQADDILADKLYFL